ncbi:integration host factor subunit alpha [Nannocystis pusilla]|uniref:integration host factor subunit alpha n=1 Tax=Nannocystis pusilla TaxID=889268 RepID=UPI003DA5C539
MTKADIIERVSDELGGLPKKEAADTVELVLELIKATLASGENVKLPGFGNFVVRHKTTRRGRNPKTGEEMVLEARRVVTFKPSHRLKAAVNT